MSGEAFAAERTEKSDQEEQPDASLLRDGDFIRGIIAGEVLQRPATLFLHFRASLVGAVGAERLQDHLDATLLLDGNFAAAAKEASSSVALR